MLCTWDELEGNLLEVTTNTRPRTTALLVIALIFLPRNSWKCHLLLFLPLSLHLTRVSHPNADISEGKRPVSIAIHMGANGEYIFHWTFVNYEWEKHMLLSKLQGKWSHLCGINHNKQMHTPRDTQNWAYKDFFAQWQFHNEMMCNNTNFFLGGGGYASQE